MLVELVYEFMSYSEYPEGKELEKSPISNISPLSYLLSFIKVLITGSSCKTQLSRKHFFPSEKVLGKL